jgi:hypothetical protein
MRALDRWYRRSAATAALLLGAGCAVGDEERRHTLNFLDAHAAPSSEAVRWALSPVALPVGLAAAVVDGVVLHPPTQFDDAWRDTVDMLWDVDYGSRFRTVLFTPFAAAATPPVYVADWVLRAVFALDDHPGDAAEAGEAKR